LARLQWAFGALGLLVTLAGALLIERLIRRRIHAETLAEENAKLYADQRTVAQTLQHSLLPQSLPEVAGLELATRYVAGVEGIDIGGDWYDIIHVDDGKLMFVVGDVSGRGLHAATMMASLRYAIRAYATQGDPPATILTKLSELVSISRDGHFATVLCGTIDVAGHRMTLANAGHPEPLLIDGTRAAFVASKIGVPVGVAGRTPYSEVTVPVPPNATLLAYTDGLVERRGESLDVGLQRLKDASIGDEGSVEDLLRRILIAAIPAGSDDDTAVLGLRWRD
jgi:serine phosphatase RsbU (regulator of sigma subunit)